MDEHSNAQNEPNGRQRSWSRSPDNDRRRSPARAMDTSADGVNGSHSTAEALNPGNNLHVSGLSLKTVDQDLEDLFSKYGKVAKCAVVMDPHTRESRGFAFVMMSNANDADAAIEALNGYELDGRSITVAKARRSRPRTPTPGEYRGPGGRDRDRRGGSRYGDRYDDRYASDRYGGGDRYDRGYRSSGRDYDRGYRRDRSPPRGYGGGYGGGYGRRYDSPPPRYDDRYGRRDDYRSAPPRGRSPY